MTYTLPTLNDIARDALRFPKHGSVHECSACGQPDVAQFLGAKKGKGQWKWLIKHDLNDCAQYRERTEA